MTEIEITENPLREVLDGWLQSGSVELAERFSELEFQLENAGWVRYHDLFNKNEFTLQGLKRIAHLARIMFLKNPLINRGVMVTADYVFGRGINIRAKDDEINQVIQSFIDDIKNQVELTSHQAMLQKDRELQIDGNVFLVFFVHEDTGACRVRSIPFNEIEDIICNPDDKKEPWYYKRTWVEAQQGVGISDPLVATDSKIKYYRDWQYDGQSDGDKIAIGDVADGVVFHLKAGSFSDWKFGVSEIYAALDWARAYKSFLENWSSLMQAYSRYAMIINTKGGNAGVQATKNKLQTTQTTVNIERNPPAVTASTFISDKELAALDVVKTAGATTKADEGRRLLLMVAAAMGLPETFFGDVGIGNHATAESLDRPTELKFSNKQEYWQSVWTRIFTFVRNQSAIAPHGVLSTAANVETNEYGEEIVVFPDITDLRISISFPEIVSLSVLDHVKAWISASTLDGKQIVLFNDRIVTEQLLNALGADNADEIITELFDSEDLAKESSDLGKVIGHLIEVVNDRTNT